MNEYSDACPECGVRQGFGKCSACLVRHDRGIIDEAKWIAAVLEYLMQPRDDLRRHLLAWANGKPWGDGPPPVRGAAPNFPLAPVTSRGTMTQVTVNLDDELFKKLDKQRKETGLSMSVLIQRAIRGKEIRDTKAN